MVLSFSDLAFSKSSSDSVTYFPFSYSKPLAISPEPISLPQPEQTFLYFTRLPSSLHSWLK